MAYDSVNVFDLKFHGSKKVIHPDSAKKGFSFKFMTGKNFQKLL